jgi:hypothetical protein
MDGETFFAVYSRISSPPTEWLCRGRFGSKELMIDPDGEWTRHQNVMLGYKEYPMSEFYHTPYTLPHETELEKL